jgi:glycosyltransferase involved in cell wall biosynthesis
LVAIFREIAVKHINIFVLLIGDVNSPIARDLTAIGVNMQISLPATKFRTGRLFLEVFILVLKLKPRTLLASGQFASIIGVMTAFFLRIPRRIFIRLHSNLHHKYNSRLGLTVDRILNYISTEIVAVSTLVKDILINDEKVPSRKVKLIPIGIDFDNFKSIEGVQNSGKSSNQIFQIGAISRMTHWKGLEYTAQAFVLLQHRNKEAHLTIIGAEADSTGKIMEILRDIDPRRYTIKFQEENIRDFLLGLDVFVHIPIGAKDEAFGIVYLESLALGVPCVFTISGVLHELKNHQQYFDVVDYANTEELLDTLLTIMEGNGFAKKKIPPVWLGKYSIDTMVAGYMKLLLEE